jgi:peptide/nickel transport system permease protein
MLRYLVKRLIDLIPLLFGITIISFAVIHLTPGDPTDLMTELNPKVSMEARARLNEIYGLDQPLHVQYGRWVKRFITLDFGTSIVGDNRPVLAKIIERIPITLTINIASMVLIFLIAIPIGVISAARPHGIFDQATTIFVFIGFSMPTFWLALLLMRWLGVELQILPIAGVNSIGYESMSGLEWFMDRVRHLVLPVGVSAFGGLAGISRYMRGSMSDVLRQDYIRTARAKGLTERRVLFDHGLRNALLPIITILGLSIPGLIGGSVIFESIFAIPGLGRFYYDAVLTRDYPVVMGLLTISAILTLIGNLVADMAYAYADPRIRVEGGT